jgi:hypothetical protein
MKDGTTGWPRERGICSCERATDGEYRRLASVLLVRSCAGGGTSPISTHGLRNRSSAPRTGYHFRMPGFGQVLSALKLSIFAAHGPSPTCLPATNPRMADARLTVRVRQPPWGNSESQSASWFWALPSPRVKPAIPVRRWSALALKIPFPRRRRSRAPLPPLQLCQTMPGTNGLMGKRVPRWTW